MARARTGQGGTRTFNTQDFEPTSDILEQEMRKLARELNVRWALPLSSEARQEQAEFYAQGTLIVMGEAYIELENLAERSLVAEELARVAAQRAKKAARKVIEATSGAAKAEAAKDGQTLEAAAERTARETQKAADDAARYAELSRTALNATSMELQAYEEANPFLPVSPSDPATSEPDVTRPVKAQLLLRCLACHGPHCVSKCASVWKINGIRPEVAGARRFKKRWSLDQSFREAIS